MGLGGYSMENSAVSIEGKKHLPHSREFSQVQGFTIWSEWVRSYEDT